MHRSEQSEIQNPIAQGVLSLQDAPIPLLNTEAVVNVANTCDGPIGFIPVTKGRHVSLNLNQQPQPYRSNRDSTETSNLPNGQPSANKNNTGPTMNRGKTPMTSPIPTPSRKRTREVEEGSNNIISDVRRTEALSGNLSLEEAVRVCLVSN